MQVRVTTRVIEYLAGTQVWADEKADRPVDFRELSDRNLMRKLIHTMPHKDNSVTVELAWPERDALLVFVEALENSASQSLPDPDALADLNAARALIRRLTA